MLRVDSPIRFLALSACLFFTVGCVTGKKQTQQEAAPPPPAAYPDSPAGYSEAGPAASGAPAPARPSAPEPFQLRANEELVTHKIESGESLSSIAGKYGTSISRIQAANNMSGTTIYAGKTIEVPTRKAASVASSAPAPAAPSAPAPPVTSYTPAPLAPAPAAPPTASSGGRFGSSSVQYQGPAGYDAGGSTEVARRDPAATSYQRVESPTAPPAPPEPEAVPPTPSFGGSRIQFSD